VNCTSGDIDLDYNCRRAKPRSRRGRNYAADPDARLSISRAETRVRALPFIRHRVDRKIEDTPRRMLGELSRGSPIASALPLVFSRCHRGVRRDLWQERKREMEREAFRGAAIAASRTPSQSGSKTRVHGVTDRAGERKDIGLLLGGVR